MPAPGGVIGSGATALGVGYCAEIRQGGMLRLGQEQRPQLILVQGLLMAGSNRVEQPDSRLMYRARQVVCRPENHS